MLGSLNDLRPIIHEWCEIADVERQLPLPIATALRNMDLFRISTPERFGGLALTESAAVRCIEQLASMDGSAGWNVMVGSNTATIATYLSEKALHEIYGDSPSTVIAGALLPKGQAQAVPGGYQLGGRWTMASGCHQADWMVACSIIMKNGAPRLRANGQPELRCFFLPKRECKLLDTWDTVGLRGTGSHDWEVHELFVPEHRSFPIVVDDDREQGALHVKDFAAYAVARVAAVSLGIARDALDSFIALAKNKVATVATVRLSEQHVTQMNVGLAEGLLRSARAFLYEAIASLPDSRTWSAPLTDDQRASMRLAGAIAARNANQVTDIVFQESGASAVYRSSRLQRCLRDIRVANQHINVAPSNVEMVGQYLLGFDLNFRR